MLFGKKLSVDSVLEQFNDIIASLDQIDKEESRECEKMSEEITRLLDERIRRLNEVGRARDVAGRIRNLIGAAP